MENVGVTRVRALGQMLSDLVGQEIVLMGHVQNVHSSSSSISLRTTDRVVINVSFNDSLQDAPRGFIQVWGSVVGPNAITAEDYWQFQEDKELDEKSYNGAVKTIHELKDFIDTVEPANDAMQF